MPTAFTFQRGSRDKENEMGLNNVAVISPNDSLPPFQITLKKGVGKPSKWEIIKEGGNSIDVTNNLKLIKTYDFSDKLVAVYFGGKMNFVFGTISEALNLPCGTYYSVFTFEDGTIYQSDNFTPKSDVSRFIKLDFWNDSDIAPIIYRDDFRQRIFLDTFVSSSTPEIEEETEKDGLNNIIPVFQKLTVKHKVVDVVSDTLKIALISMQMHDNVTITIEGEETLIDRVLVTAQPHDTGGMNDVEINLETDAIYKTRCGENESPTSVGTW